MRLGHVALPRVAGRSTRMSFADDQVSKGRPGDALAIAGDEGRGMLRKAPGRRKHPLIR
jgi:hypothetical protein